MLLGGRKIWIWFIVTVISVFMGRGKGLVMIVGYSGALRTTAAATLGWSMKGKMGMGLQMVRMRCGLRLRSSTVLGRGCDVKRSSGVCTTMISHCNEHTRQWKGPSSLPLSYLLASSVKRYSYTTERGEGGRRKTAVASTPRDGSGADATNGDGEVVPIELETELKTSFMQYAMSTILGRALPDARDGLKPVHRRILYAMHGLNLQPDGGYRKSARVVGEVLGKYHPHGDVAVYDALVRMAQDFIMSSPLVSGHGNFGSIDNDPAAAMRYTESKLSHVARDSLLQDIALDTVDFVPNFDGNENEPVVLPARLPMLLLNGGSGIAVGMATNIPPHNLGELVSATVALIRNPHISDDDLLKIIPAPDFPTGGRIMGLSGARKLYATGNGGVVVRATTHIEQGSSGIKGKRSAIVVTEMTYQVNKAALLERLAALVNEKKIDGIADLRDESDRDGIRMVIELKRDAVPRVVLNNLYQKTQLQMSFSGNILALGGGGTQPQRFTLRGALQEFIDFRFSTLRRRTSYELRKVSDRNHIVQGMLSALGRMDEIIELIRGATTQANAKQALRSDVFDFSEEQADAILGLRLGRLTSMEEGRLKREHEELESKAAVLHGLMTDDTSMYNVMISELEELSDRHAVPRRSILMTEEGYVKRMEIGEFHAQARGGRGKAGAKLLGDEDAVEHFLTCSGHDNLLLVSSRGIAYSIRAYQIPVASRTARGVPIPEVLPISRDEHINSIISLSSFSVDNFLVLLTQKGFIKKTPLAVFENLQSRGLTIASLEDEDNVIRVKMCSSKDSILIATKGGYAIRFSAGDDQLRPTGRMSRGVNAMKYRNGDEAVDMEILPGGDGDEEKLRIGSNYVIVVTSSGFGKRVDISEFRLQRRGGMGVICTKFKPGSNDSVAALRRISDNDDVMLSTTHGTIVRQPAADISGQSRSATGVRVQRLDTNDYVTKLTVLPHVVIAKK